MGVRKPRFPSCFMTSPYLQRPKRSLDQALIDTGRARREVESEQPAAAMAPPRRRGPKGPAVPSRNRIALAFAVGLALLAATTFVALRSEFEQPVASGEDPARLNDIAPASGASGGEPDQPAANIETWGDAPSLELPTGSGSSGD